MSEALRRAVHTLDVLSKAESDLSIRELAEATEVSKSAVQRILSSLVETGLAVQDPSSRRYGLGPRTLVLGTAYQRRIDLRAVASVFDSTGRFAPTYDDSDVITLEADACVLAIGQRADLSFLTPADGVELTPSGVIKVDPTTLATSAPGVYSGFANQGTQGQTFLRGVQTTDANGAMFFDTIYPGWYQGRATHIHLKVRPTGQSELTTQLYFRQRLTNRVYQTGPYFAHGPNPTTNQTDSLFRPETVVDIVQATGGQLVLAIVIAVA